MEDKEICAYHGRAECKACRALTMALLAERKNALTLLESQLTKAVVFEAAGE